MTDAQQARVVEVIWSARRHAARRP
jgi:hypothetical protein